MSKKRLIDATKLKTDMYLLATLGDNENIFIDVIIDEIDNADDVDAVEVVHGQWVDEFGGKYANPKYICSHCTLKALDKKKRDVLGNWHTVQALTDYCPNCGAKMMDGDENV